MLFEIGVLFGPDRQIEIELVEGGGAGLAATGTPPLSGMLSAALLFLYFSGGRDRTMTWDIHRNERQLC